MGGIFDDLDPTRQGDSIVKGAARIEQSAAQKKESARWSIAELQLSLDDLAWLHEWANSLLPDQAELNLQYSSRSPKFGLLFLTLAAEVCRRETEESEAWPIIRSIGWKPEVKAVLFSKQGAAKPLLCHAIEAACLRYGLRNIVRQQGRMHWFTSIKLQFGLTRTGLKEQLGKWLYLDTLPSVGQLLLADEENRSDSFARLIESLEAYQDGFKHEEELRKILLASPWILDDWVDDVLSAAQRKPAVVRAEWSPPEPPALAIDDDAQSVVCVGEASLVWNAGKVEFVVPLREELDQLCSCDRFFVAVAEETKALFIQQRDGGFARAGGSGRDIQLAAVTPNVCVAVADGSSEPLAVQLLSLFDPDAELEAWVEGRHGRSEPVDPQTHSFEPSRSYTFRVPIDAVVKPQNTASCEWSSGSHKWIRMRGGWSADLRILLDDTELFASCERYQEPSELPGWIAGIAVRSIDVDWDRGSFRLRISLPSGARLLGARVFGKAISFTDSTYSSLQSTTIPLEFSDVKGSVDVRIAAVCGEDHRVIRRSIDLPLDGLLLNCRGVWQRHSPNDDLNVGEIRRLPCLVHVPTPSDSSDRQWIAIQGYREVGIPRKRPGQLRDLAGWGQPLELAEGRFNRPAGNQRRKLASRVIDRGCVLDCVQIGGSADVIVRLQDPIEPSHEHGIVVWTSEGHLVAIGREAITPTENGGSWRFDRPSNGLDYSGRIVAIAVAYRGKRLGAWWTDDWCRYVRRDVCSGHAKEIAAIVRWFQFPLLDRRTVGTIRALVEENGLAFAEAWLVWRDDRTNRQPTSTDRLLATEHLRPPTADPAWYEVVREMFTNWRPQPDEAEQLEKAFEQIDSNLNEPVDPPLPLASLVEQVGEAAPILAGRLVQQWLSGKSECAGQAKALLRALAEQIQPRTIDGSSRNESDDFDPRVDGLRLSTPFLGQILETARSQCNGTPADAYAAENLQILLQHPNVSRLVTAHLLECLGLTAKANHVTT